MNDAIISIKPKHVENILSGEKKVELRTRKINLPVGSRLWVYTTLPVGKINLHVEISFVVSLSPKEMWDEYKDQICITKKEFDDYTRGKCIVSAIGLNKINILDRGICLQKLREYEKGFQPPQFISMLYPERALYSALYN
ncbi:MULTISPECIES: ASCH domain-containing protein [Halomonas]|uniref:ASCH domain-containing protein n=1 Tax=Halomonas citrativorans TaxID=2742612 RepID=A0ABR9FAR2_9GAMM|nr:ASCH domain-containing protein [Halomonas citrativorans]MBE0403575.1 ASCH domain-containing protein [Halomonas citrativorans]